jgi:hypothetical protein
LSGDRDRQKPRRVVGRADGTDLEQERSTCRSLELGAIEKGSGAQLRGVIDDSSRERENLGVARAGLQDPGRCGLAETRVRLLHERGDVLCAGAESAVDGSVERRREPDVDEDAGR